MLIMWSYFTYYRGERKMERMDACSGPYERMCWPHVFFLGYFSLEWLSRARAPAPMSACVGHMSFFSVIFL